MSLVTHFCHFCIGDKLIALSFYRKRTDMDIMAAAFEPLRVAFVKRKRELSAEIVAHYDSLKPELEACVTKCTTYLHSLKEVVTELMNLFLVFYGTQLSNVVQQLLLTDLICYS